MLRVYCKTCGSPNMYTLEKPKFCQGCGKALGAVSANKQQKQKRPLVQKPSVEEAEDEEDYEEEENIVIPDIDRLDVEIQARGPSTHTFGELGESEHSVYDAGDQSLPRDTRSTSEVVQEFRKEAGLKGDSSKQSPPQKTTGRSRGRPRGSKNKKK